MESQDHLADNKVRNEQVGGGGEVGGSPVSLHNPLYCGSNVILNQTQNSIKEKRCADTKAGSQNGYSRAGVICSVTDSAMGWDLQRR